MDSLFGEARKDEEAFARSRCWFGQGRGNNDTVEPHVLCEHCRKVCDQSKLLRSLPEVYENRPPRPMDENSFRRVEIFSHCSSSTELEESSNRGCHLCTLMWSLCRSDKSSIIRSFENRAESTKQTRTWAVVWEDSTSKRCYLGIEFGNGCRLGCYKDFDKLSIYPSSDKRCGPTNHTLPAQISISTSSDASFALVRNWLDDCISNHTVCCRRSHFSPELPTRLIRISDSKPLKLRLYLTEPSDTEIAYLTMSHVWGNTDRLLKLTSARLESWRQDLPINDMPQSFRDAIVVTWRLGYRYIWIDSLCIIQDSREDWRKESVRMAVVYGNSACNIGSVGLDGHDGCFFKRNPLRHRPCRMLESGQYSVYAQSYSDPKQYQEEFFLGSLFTRAWILQERLLAPRNIYYRSHELFWECCEHLACESWVDGMLDREHDALDATRGLTLKGGFALALEPPSRATRQARQTSLHTWHQIVNEYTRSALTFGTDRLVALSGIAGLLQRRTGATYLAGLWEECLPLDLLWHTGYALRGRRPPEWRAPTWSWASIDGPVWFLDQLNPMYPYFDVTCRADMLQWGVIPLQHRAGALGEVSQGSFLQISSLLKPMKLSIAPEGNRSAWENRNRYTAKPDTLAPRSDISYPFDPDFELPASTRIFFCLITSLTCSKLESLHRPGFVLRDAHREVGLVLRPMEMLLAGEDGVYSRVGYFCISYNEDEFHDKQTLFSTGEFRRPVKKVVTLI